MITKRNGIISSIIAGLNCIGFFLLFTVFANPAWSILGILIGSSFLAMGIIGIVKIYLARNEV